MREPDGLQLFTLVVHWLSLWLGLYLVDRRPRSPSTVLTGAAVVSMSLYVLGTALLFDPQPISAAREWWGGVATCLVYFAPVLLLHAMLRLTAVRLPAEKVVLTVAYLTAAAVSAMSWSDTLLYEVSRTVSSGGERRLVLEPGPLYSLAIVQILLTGGLTVGVVLVRRLSRPRPVGESRRQLDMLVAGASLTLVGAGLMLANAVAANPVPEGAVEPLVMVGVLLVAVPLTRYTGLLEGQLLRTDLWSSLLGVVLLVVVLVAGGEAVDATTAVFAVGGAVMVAVYVFIDDLRGLVDRVFFDSTARAQRAGLRRAATFAGSSGTIDLETLLPGQASEVIAFLTQVDRAELASTRIEARNDVRLELLGREAYAPVRAALGLPGAWRPEDGLSPSEVRPAVAARLEPRERQALGLKYLGCSDKEMARLMGVKPNVPRSYLSAGKRKLGVPSGAPVMLYVHFAGLLENDVMPLFSQRAAERRAT